MLSRRKGKEAYVEPVIEGDNYSFIARIGKPKDVDRAKRGTKLSRGANFECLMSGTPIGEDYIMSEAKAGRMGARLMAIVAEGDRERLYLTSTAEHEVAAERAEPEWKPDVDFFKRALGFRIGNYGMSKWSDLFSPRQIVALDTFHDLIQDLTALIRLDCAADSSSDIGAKEPSPSWLDEYAKSIALYVVFALDKGANLWSTYASG